MHLPMLCCRILPVPDLLPCIGANMTKCRLRNCQGINAEQLFS